VGASAALLHELSCLLVTDAGELGQRIQGGEACTLVGRMQLACCGAALWSLLGMVALFESGRLVSQAQGQHMCKLKDIYAGVESCG